MRKLFHLLIILSLFGCGNVIHRDRNIKKSNEKLNRSDLKIEKFSVSECIENCELESSIINQNLVNNTYFVTIGAYLNCSGRFESEIEMRLDTLNLKITVKANEDGVVEMTSCNCLFHINYTITGLKRIPKEILINGETLKKNFETESDIAIIDSIPEKK